MAIKNIDDEKYEDLYVAIDSNFLVRLFQAIKLRTIFPVYRLAKKNSSCVDIGCAKGNFLHTLQNKGYSNLTGLDLKNVLYPSLQKTIQFYQASICEKNLKIQRRFENVFVQAMLHHLPADSLEITAENISHLLEKDGYLYIYEPNMVSLVGKFFYFYFLRIFPELYRATLAEKPEQLAFCKAWPGFIAKLEKSGIERIKLSDFLFYKIYVGRKSRV